MEELLEGLAEGGREGGKCLKEFEEEECCGRERNEGKEGGDKNEGRGTIRRLGEGVTVAMRSWRCDDMVEEAIRIQKEA